MMHPQYPRSSSGMRGGRNNSNGMNSHPNAGNGMVHNNTNRSSSRPKSRSRSKSLGRRQGNNSGQSSLSAHIQQQMERPRRGERDPTPLSRSAHNKSAPGLNYNGQPPPQPQSQQFSSPPRRNSSAMPRRNQSTNNNVDDLSPSSSEERAAIAANLAKNSFSAHQNLQKLIDEQREREFHRMEHAQQNNMMQVYHPMHPQNQQQQMQQMQVYHPQHLQQEQQYDPSAPSSVAAVHHEQPQHQTPLKLMVGQDGFTRCSVSTMTPLTPSSSAEREFNNAALLSPDVVGQGCIPQIRRVTATTTGRNGGFNHHDPQQQEQRRRSTSPKKPNRDHLNVVPRLPNFDEEQLNAIAAEHPDLELAQSIAKIMAFQRKSTAQGGGPSQSRQIVSYDDNNAAQQQHPPRRSKSQLRMDAMDRNDSSEIIKNEKARSSFHSNSTAPTTASSLNSGSLFASSTEPSSNNNHNSSSFKTPPVNTSKQQPPQMMQRQNSSTPRYLDKETLYNHLQDAPRESRVQLTRLIENLQSENHRLNELTMTQGNQIDKLESEIGGLLRELLRYRREFGEMTTVADGGGSEGDVSSEHATAATPPTATSSPSRQMHSFSRVESIRQDSITKINEDEELDVVPPYVKSKSLHEDSSDRPRRTPADKRRLSSSSATISSPSSGGSNPSFDHKMNMLKQFQLTSPSSHSNRDDNDNGTRRSYSDRTADDSFHTAVESIFDSNASAKQRSFKEEKKADTEATLRWSGMRDINDEEHDAPQSNVEGNIDEEQPLLMQQQRKQDENHQDEVSPETRLRSNSLEDVFEPQSRRSCFVEQKGGITSSGSVSGSVPSMTDTVGSCSWSYSTPDSGGK
mmetsp:Transcript_11653/g.16692  ORF Transcript_11653/g.16692 Transcript_11653/m.16692 type:complete len:850 (+) Transcript_11653:108-2657(+)